MNNMLQKTAIVATFASLPGLCFENVVANQTSTMK